jgi:chemotaxis protein methyltransferase CheR
VPTAPARTGLPEVRPLTDREFRLFQALVLEQSGIHLTDVKRALLVGRLSKRLRELGLESFEAYYRLIVDGPDKEERVRMINCICTHETHFFREPKQWELLEQTVLPRWREQGEAGERPRRIRAWSAACSSGEEPFTLAMSLLAHLPASWDIEILATDLSTAVLERARQAIWSIEKAAEIPADYLKRFMLRGRTDHGGTYAGRMKAGPALRQVVKFQQHNLNESHAVPGAPFDLIFCRNVLIYFSPESKPRVIDHLLSQLAPAGMLFLGHAESLNGINARVRGVIPSVYRFAP